MKSKPNGLSGEEEHPSEDQSSVDGFRALRAEMKPDMLVLKRSRSVAWTAVSWRAERSAGAARVRDARPVRAVMRENFMLSKAGK
jgi:hypothetical protein